MIAPQELRLGNLVTDSTGRIFTILELLSDYSRVYSEKKEWLNSQSKTYIDLEPIELNEDWLLKFGFEHTGGGFYTHLPSLIQACNVSDKFYNVGFKDANIGRFYYVHQLQNLYFALTGEELTIK